MMPRAIQRRHLMLQQTPIAPVAETPREPSDQIETAVERAQQQRPRVRRHRPAAEIRDHTLAFKPFKLEQRRRTLCLHRASRTSEISRFPKTTFSDSSARCIIPFEISGLVFIDETGAKTNMARLRGRSLKGQRLHAAIP